MSSATLRRPGRASSTCRSDVQRRQILASSCARATSAGEARHRIAAPIEDRRSTAVVALDPAARAIVDTSRHRRSARVRFAAFENANGRTPATDAGEHLAGRLGLQAVAIEDLDGPGRPPTDAVADPDLVVMVATSASADAGAATVGRWCAERRIMTAGLAVGLLHGVDLRERLEGAAAALRPHARMLLVTEDAGDLDEILTALRA